MKIGKKKLGAAILMSLALVLCLQGIVYACVLFGYVGEGGGWGSDHTESFYAGSQNFKRQADGLGSTIPSTDGWGTFYYNLDETSPRWAWYYTSAGSSFPLNSWGRFPDLDQEGNEEQDDIAIGIIHARAAEGPRPNNMFDPHPFIYDLNGREIAFAHHGFINANGWQDTITEEVIGLNYMALPVFDRACLDDDVWEVVDSEFYGVAMMKNVLIADNYHSRYGSLDTDWAVNRTLAKIQEEMPNGYTSLNCLLQDTSSIFAVCQVTDSNHRLAVFRWWDVDVNPAEQTDNIAIMSARDPLVGAFDYYEYGDDYTGHGYYDPAFTVEDEPDGYLEDGTYTVVHSDGTVDTPSALRAFSDTPYVQNYILNEEEDGNQFNSSVAYSKYSDDDNWYEYEMGSVYQSDGKIYFRPLNQMGLFEQGEIVVFDSETREYSDPDLAFDPTTNDVYVVARSAASATPSAFKKIVMKILDFDTSVEGPADFEGNFDSASTRTWNLGGLVTIETADDEVGPPSIDFADNGKAVVVWSEQKWLDHHEVAGRIVSDGGTDGDVEYLLPAVHRTYTTLFPDIAYIGTDGTDECFAVVYNMSEAPNGTNGVY
ncbi:MAG TPA: hypothetical protein ENH10_10395, partial [Bacteroidetes bacterium]|nr:hypothetical protein [Bacteroidota bacterium]HEX05541.1 hypothetical protein [Bacteroidota bacterium]